MELVERVARAICVAETGGPLGYFPDGSPMRDGGNWDEYVPYQHEEWRKIARAAIAAMPAADLLEEALKALEDLEAANDRLSATRSSETYLSMIDRDEAALKLIQLDEARANARAILTKSRGEKIDG